MLTSLMLKTQAFEIIQRVENSVKCGKRYNLLFNLYFVCINCVLNIQTEKSE